MKTMPLIGVFAIFCVLLSFVPGYAQPTESRRDDSAERPMISSFLSPFREIDFNGKRIIGRAWKILGETMVYRNFLRLIPDYPRKFGATLSNIPVGRDSLYAVLNFRISGKLKPETRRGLAMDSGMGIWLVHPPSKQSSGLARNGGGDYSEDSLHGFTEGFKGIGFTIDNFVDSPRSKFRGKKSTVNLLVNVDGEADYQQMRTKHAKGCSAMLDFSEDRSDFSAFWSSKIKIVVEEQRLVMSIDEINSGQWIECINVENLGFTDNAWLEEVLLRITAMNGKHSTNNYDLFSLRVYPSEGVLMQQERKSNNNNRSSKDKDKTRNKDEHSQSIGWSTVGPSSSVVTVTSRTTVEEDLVSMATAVDRVMGDMAHLEHRIEHDMSGILEGIRKVAGHVQFLEANNELRIDSLEQDIKQLVSKSLAKSTSLRQAVISLHSLTQNLDGRFIGAGLNESLYNSNTVSWGGGTWGWSWSWRVPFVVLSLLLFVGLVAFYLFYRRLRKMHLI